jgi:hypothetical protein
MKMADNQYDPRRFRLVKSPARESITAAQFEDTGTLQRSLFPSPKAGLMIFVYFPDVSEIELRQTFEFSRASFVMELRTSPRFDIGRLNREQAFQIFSKQNTTYLDLTSEWMGKSNTNGLLESFVSFMRTHKPSFERPFVFLMNRRESDEAFIRCVVETVANFTAVPSEVYEVPHFSSGPT